MINKYNAKTDEAAFTDTTKEQQLTALEGARAAHKKESLELVDQFVAAILESFAADSLVSKQ